MIEYTCDKGMVKLSVQGSGMELVADTLTLVHELHKEISKENLFHGLAYAECIKQSIDVALSPLSGDYDEEQMNEE